MYKADRKNISIPRDFKVEAEWITKIKAREERTVCWLMGDLVRGEDDTERRVTGEEARKRKLKLKIKEVFNVVLGNKINDKEMKVSQLGDKKIFIMNKA